MFPGTGTNRNRLTQVGRELRVQKIRFADRELRMQPRSILLKLRSYCGCNNFYWSRPHGFDIRHWPRPYRSIKFQRRYHPANSPPIQNDSITGSPARGSPFRGTANRGTCSVGRERFRTVPDGNGSGTGTLLRANLAFPTFVFQSWCREVRSTPRHWLLCASLNFEPRAWNAIKYNKPNPVQRHSVPPPTAFAGPRSLSTLRAAAKNTSRTPAHLAEPPTTSAKNASYAPEDGETRNGGGGKVWHRYLSFQKCFRCAAENLVGGHSSERLSPREAAKNV